jgi:hypothetical protein
MFWTKSKIMLNLNINLMSLSKHLCTAALVLCVSALVAVPATGFGQTNYYSADGTEYALVGSLPGDQMFPDVALNPTGGFVVWQDNVTDGSGWGVSAEKLDSTFAATLSPFRVNVQGTNNQQNPHVALLKNGGAAFVWQGGASALQHIYARFLSPTNTWLTTTDVVVSTFTSSFQTTPALSVLNNGNVVIVWASYDQAATSSMLDVYGAIFSATGQTISNAFLINQFTAFNQRSPCVTALQGGGFAVAWISEQENLVAPNLGSNSLLQATSGMTLPSVDVYARLYQSNGVPVSNEILVDQVGNPCASPALAPASNGGFLVVWSAHNMENRANGWDIYARPFSSAGTGGSTVTVNSYLYGDQYAPKVSAIGLDFLVAWTSLAQDGSREGVFGQFVHDDGSLVGGELLVNTTTQGQQMQPAVASDGSAWFQVVWTSFTGLNYGFDLYAQRYAGVAAVLQPMNAPFIYAPFNVISNNYVPQLEVSWPSIPGLSVASFQVFVDGSSTAVTNISSTTNRWVMGPANGLTASSTHSFQVGYVTTSGGVSPISPSASGSTWSGLDYYGIPFEWMEEYYGNFSDWPANVNAPLALGGMSLYSIFLSGGDPLDPSTWLSTSLVRTSEGVFLNWNTQPGMTYQVQESTNFASWSNFGAARFEAGTNDSLYVGTGSTGYFRVVLLRQ